MQHQSHALMIDSAPQTSGAICILCLSQQIRQQDTHLSMQKFHSFKSVADSIPPHSISIHKMKSGEQCKYLLNKISQDKVHNNSQQSQHEQIQSQNFNVCINCVSKAEQELQKLVKSEKEPAKMRILQQQKKLRKSRSAHSKFIHNNKRQYLAHDDDSISQSQNKSGDSVYLSKIAYRESSMYLKPSKVALNQEDQVTNAHSGTKTSQKITVHDQKKQQFIKQTLALESNEETQVKNSNQFKKNKPLSKLIITGFPKKQQKRMINMHRSIQTLVQKVSVRVVIPMVEEVSCKYCEYILQKQCAIKSRLSQQSWVCRTCFTLNQEQIRLLSFDRKRDNANNQLSRKKRAQTLNKGPRTDRQNVYFLPYTRNTRVISHNHLMAKQEREENQCVICHKKGITLVKDKGKNYCIYCYYHQRDQ